LAGWVEFALLRRRLRRLIAAPGYPLAHLSRMWLAALVAAAAGNVIEILLRTSRPLIVGAAVLVPYGLIYLGLMHAMGMALPMGPMGRLFSSRTRPPSR
jgi:putative peptidoglycan lipid II flippase